MHLYIERRVTRGGGGEGGFPCPSSKIGKKCPNLEKKCLDCDHLWVQFIIQNEISRGKTHRFFPCGAFLSRVVGECLSKCPNLKKTPLL